LIADYSTRNVSTLQSFLNWMKEDHHTRTKRI